MAQAQPVKATELKSDAPRPPRKEMSAPAPAVKKQPIITDYASL